jgi:cyclase
VINTHFHGDHNENNENLAKLGAMVFAHPSTRIELARPGRGGVSRPPAGLPMVTSSELFSFHFNGEEVVYVPLKKSHSPGNVGVYFKGSDVFAFGDVFTNDYPSMDFQHGGTVENFIDNLQPCGGHDDSQDCVRAEPRTVGGSRRPDVRA